MALDFYLHRARPLALLFGLAIALALPAGAQALNFAPIATQTGPEQRIFDWSAQKCADWDVPDTPARAIRDSNNKVQLFASHYDTRRKIGNDLASATQHQCTPVMTSHKNSDPAKWDDLEWISSPYTLDGQTIYVLQHMEYRGWNYGTCTPPGWAFNQMAKCWYNALTFTTSTNAGASYSHATSPNHLVASSPDRFATIAGNGPDGVFTPSNIVKHSDGYYYTLARVTKTTGGEGGTCALRTKTLSDPKSWRAWNGTSFSFRFKNPYLESASPRAQHICTFVSRPEIGSMSESLTWSDYFNRFILVGVNTPINPQSGAVEPGFYFSLSEDLVHWTPAKPLVNATVPSPVVPNCGDPNPVRDPSLIDPASTSRSFETIGRTTYLYYAQLRVAYGSDYCYWPQDRDLMRVPLSFNGSPPRASLSVSPNPATAGQWAHFDGSGSTDSNGSIVKYEWDVDGDGSFEWNSGSDSTVDNNFPAIKGHRIGLRVTDNEGLADYAYKPLNIAAKVNQQPDASSTPATFVKDSGAAYSDARGWGWVRQDSLQSATHTALDLSVNTRDRDSTGTDSTPRQQDTLIFMQAPSGSSGLTSTPGAFEMAVPCGVYEVTVSVGDSSFSSSSDAPENQSVHRVNVEGRVPIAGFQPSNAVKFATATTVVGVCDGRLTIDAVGGSNTKLNYVSVVRTNPKINFQPLAPATPAGHGKDFGQQWWDARGYGWVRQDSLGNPTATPLDLSANGRDRDPNAADRVTRRQDTLIFMQAPSNQNALTATPGAWEMALPCGNYAVTVSVGDSLYAASKGGPLHRSTHQVNIEGVAAIKGWRPTDSAKFRTGAKTVSVCDGRLTIDAIGGSNTKLNFILVTPVGS